MVSDDPGGQGGAHHSAAALHMDGGLQCDPCPGSLDPAALGTASLSPAGAFVAGSLAEFVLVYTAGVYGIDDSGSIRLCFRFATDQSPLQADDPAVAGFTVVEASNNAVLECRYSDKGNVRPWDKCLEVKVVRGFLECGDTITFRIGDRRQGGPGHRLQTFVESTFEFRILVDPIAAYNFQALPEQPSVEICAGPAARILAVAPTLRRTGQAFSVHVKAEDRWGNPTGDVDMRLDVSAEGAVRNLPAHVDLQPGQPCLEIPGLVADDPGVAHVVLSRGGEELARANPTQIVEETDLLAYWGDLHGQSEETIGTNSIRDYFEFARDRAFLDVSAHQGNDFQMTDGFWSHLNALTSEMTEPGRFVLFPGYEWSGNTALGGDRNVFYRHEGRPIRRSSSVLTPDAADHERLATTAAELFEILDAGKEDVVCYAHCGGRYADIAKAHHPSIETAVEIHSSWGTFEWLAYDAFEKGYRVGFVANSDGHKGRPGASYPGSGLFGAIGGLTCFLAPELTRDAIFAAMRGRRHYATTGGPSGRIVLDVSADLGGDGTLFATDPAIGAAASRPASRAEMGDIVRVGRDRLSLSVSAAAASPIERIELFNGKDHVDSFHPHGRPASGSRLRIEWEGAAYRGRFRKVVWDGRALVEGTRILNAKAVNFFNADHPVRQVGTQQAAWRSVTTGNFAGVDLWLEVGGTGRLKVETPLVKETVDLGRLGPDEYLYDRSELLPRFLKIYRLPNRMDTRSVSCVFQSSIGAGRDNPFYVRLTLEDGTRAWSSPIYVLPG